MAKKMIYYLDTSALVKRYVFEMGSQWLVKLCDAENNNMLVTASITRVEASAVFALKYRQKALSLRLYNHLLQSLDDDFRDEYQLMTIDLDLVELATQMTRQHKLRGYDAVQLAAALTLHRTLVLRGLPVLQFLSSDVDLLNAAQAEGLTIDDPNQHP